MRGRASLAHRNRVFRNGERVKADLILLAVAVIWGSGFVVQRIAAPQVGPFVYNGVRFLMSVIVILPSAWNRRPLTRLEWKGGALMGLLIFGGSALQQAGLALTTAGKAGLITGLYAVFVPLLLAGIWRQRLPWPAWVASFMAAIGLFMLSAVESQTLAFGDVLELAGAVLFALHVILIGQLALKVDVMRVTLVQNLVCGLLSTLVGLPIEFHTLGGLAAVWWCAAYSGILVVGLGYTLQVAGQRQAPAADAAIILSGEAVFAVLAGWLVLGETLMARQLLGCGLMLTGMLLAQVHALRQDQN